MQTTFEEYKEWTEDGSVDPAVQTAYDKAKAKAEKLMQFENDLVGTAHFICGSKSVILCLFSWCLRH